MRDRQHGQFGENYDVGYAIPSTLITTEAVVVLVNTKAFYHGFVYVASATAITAYVYDNSSTASGNLLDIISVTANKDTRDHMWIPIVAQNGITISVTGSLGKGIIFYGPRG